MKKTGFNKESKPLLAHSFGAVLLRLPVLAMAMVRPTLPRALREQVMLGVNSVNGCRYCSWAHTGLALAHGVNLDELACLLDSGTFGKIDERDATAILFAQNFADTVRNPTQDARDALAKCFTAKSVANSWPTSTPFILVASPATAPTHGSFGSQAGRLKTAIRSQKRSQLCWLPRHFRSAGFGAAPSGRKQWRSCEGQK